MARNIEFLPALRVTSYAVGRNHDPGNTDTAKSDLSLSIQFGTVEYLIGSGGIELSGSAATEYSSGPVTYTYSVSGGVTISGSAPLAVVLNVQPTGGVTLAGSAPIAAGRTFSPSGGVTLTGAATLAITHAVAVSGGVELAGAATTSYLSAGATEYPYLASGGIELSGTAATQYTAGQTEQTVVSGGGGAVYRPRQRLAMHGPGRSFDSRTYEYTGSARIGVTGSAATSKASVFTAKAQGFIALRPKAKIRFPIRQYKGYHLTVLRGSGAPKFFSPVLEQLDEIAVLALLN